MARPVASSAVMIAPLRRGFSVGYGWKMKKFGEVDLTTYFFDLDQDEQMYVFGIAVTF